MNERSLLPVLDPTSPAGSLVARFQAATADVLRASASQDAAVEAECREMLEVSVGKTVSRRDPLNLDAIALRLAATPCGPLGMKHPADVALEMMVRR